MEPLTELYVVYKVLTKVIPGMPDYMENADTRFWNKRNGMIWVHGKQGGVFLSVTIDENRLRIYTRKTGTMNYIPGSQWMTHNNEFEQTGFINLGGFGVVLNWILYRRLYETY